MGEAAAHSFQKPSEPCGVNAPVRSLMAALSQFEAGTAVLRPRPDLRQHDLLQVAMAAAHDRAARW